MTTFLNARFLTQPLTGVQRFSLEISKQLNAIRDDLVFLVHSKKEVVDQKNLELFNIQEVKGGTGHYWEQTALPRYLRKMGNPILINLCNTAPVLYKNKIFTHHDITYIRYPQSYSLSFRAIYRLMANINLHHSRKIITVSNFSKQDIADFFNINHENIEVLYNGVSDSFKPNLYTKDSKKKFALTVSSPNLHKNFNAMVEAFLQTKLDLDLKIIGSASSIFKDPNYSSSDERVHFLGRITDEELISLYQSAEFFIFPSLYEGFGIPPLEAQACGCPVVSSNAASLPEVLEKSAYYFDPKDITSMRLAIEKVAGSELLRGQLIQAGFENLKRFSWESSARRLNTIIDNLSST